ncbi:MAG: exodeoxyribonuclease VII small subunit [Oscillospiraceae bacterium]|nr:exodeoxyribonuclease VII small subunit [Oscillospiraceae bacterium]
MAGKKMNFEQSLKRLDEIVSQLERGDAPLDESLSLFEEGTALVKSCGKLLDEAEQKVVKLRRGADGAPIEEPFDGEE